MAVVFLDVDADHNLIIAQGDQRIVLTPAQLTTMIDTLLGPSKVKTVEIDMDALLSEDKSVDSGLN
jgi:hypothetical protein